VPETIEKLRPDRDLQCYFERPSAIAAMSEATATGFNVSGTWRQQFDWAVIEWNQHNVIEHPYFRSLPDGDLSDLVLTYEETRSNCIPMDSNLFPTVDWPYLRFWTRENGAEDFYRVRLTDHATAIEGSYAAAAAELDLTGSITTGDYVGISFLEEHHTYQVLGTDTLESTVQAIVDSIQAFSTHLTATRTGTRLQVTLADLTTGLDGNRLGLYGFVSGAKTEIWAPWAARFAGGASPTKWRVTLDFSNLTAIDGRPVPAHAVRKMRWTYAAGLQDGAYQRSEFAVNVSNWVVAGTNRAYQVAGPGSRRIEDNDAELTYTGSWTAGLGNFSGGTIRHTTTPGAGVSCTYTCPQAHLLFVGGRYAFNGATAEFRVNGALVRTEDLLIAGEDVLARISLGNRAAGTYTVSITHAGPAGGYVYFDFVELAIATQFLPAFPVDDKVTLATDWDTDHSLAVPAERTAWMIHGLGFHGRANHYVGALWFYELYRPGHIYASATVDFVGTPVFSATTQITIGREGDPSDTVISHVNRIGDTAETLAKAFELELNRGYTAIRAQSSGARLTIYARAMGADGNKVTVAVSPASGVFHLEASGTKLAGGVDGDWRTDLVASPRLNRAVRDWSRSFYQALKDYGIDVTAAFSMELQHGDPSPSTGIAQRYPNGVAVQLNTPALQTNFSPVSRDYWRDVYREMAGLQSDVGLQPYLQFGEVQWWYFPLAGSGMPFYDAYTTSTFQSQYGHPMAVIPSDQADPALYPEEVQFLPALIGAFTSAVMSHVRAGYPTARFEVLYPTDVNNTALNRLINYPTSEWTAATLDNLKTESFTFTFLRNLDLSQITVKFGETKGFSRAQRSFLVGIGDSSAPWKKEVAAAKADALESIVLFALDQFCLIGYAVPVSTGSRRCAMIG
jgi:hypothetical protein